jgi:hypothetical protein
MQDARRKYYKAKAKVAELRPDMKEIEDAMMPPLAVLCSGAPRLVRTLGRRLVAQQGHRSRQGRPYLKAGLAGPQSEGGLREEEGCC